MDENDPLYRKMLGESLNKWDPINDVKLEEVETEQGYICYRRPIFKDMPPRKRPGAAAGAGVADGAVAEVASSFRYKQNYVEPDDEYNLEDYNIQYNEENKHHFASIYIPKNLIGYLIGLRRCNIIEIEKQADCRVEFPSRDSNENGPVIVRGKTHVNVYRGCERIVLKIMEKRKSLRPSHFFAFEVQDDTVLKNYNDFKKQANRIGDITSDLFQLPEKLHQTLALLCLFDKKEAEKVIELFKTFMNSKDEYKKCMKILLQGVDIMNDDPEETHVLFAKIQKSGDYDKLIELGERLTDYFYDKGFVTQRYKSNIKAHVTLMNSTFKARIESNTTDDSLINKQPFDTREIIKKFKDFNFGEMIIRSIGLYETSLTTSSKGDKNILQTIHNSLFLNSSTPKLTELHLHDCVLVYSFLQHLARNHPNLELLIVERCRSKCNCKVVYCH